MLGVPTPYTPVPWSASEQYGVRLQLCGWPAAADAYGERGCVVRGDMSTLDSPALFWNRDRLVGTACVGRPAEFEELRRIVANHPHADLDLLADPATGLAVVGR
ncbi:oxidoreductase C-terminal domain-containing protein [Streptoalloteichus hindustanus]|uniref:oxidoreductase C-terminal domain-containing protein n=1 Tax=Streptoalloteichus hindustanus TaxID=2017 RepID=UPI00228589DE|nr:oxidoreductase C-terminal domain-containing protein [Streptoalloteichus hindustanus]